MVWVGQVENTNILPPQWSIYIYFIYCVNRHEVCVGGVPGVMRAAGGCIAITSVIHVRLYTKAY